MPISIDFNKIRPLLSDNSLLLTPNTRTQKALLAGYMASFAEGETVKAPEILTFSQWQEQLWQQLSFIQPLPRLLGNLELKHWLKAQIKAEEAWQLTNVLGVAEKVLTGYRDLCLWNKTLDDLEAGAFALESPETRCFVQWTRALEDFSQANDLLPEFSRTRVLVEAYENIKVDLCRPLLLVGFNQLMPIEQSLLAKVEDAGGRVSSYFPKRAEIDCSSRQNAHQANIHRIQANDLTQEIEIAAAMAKDLADSEQDITLGIVVHQLQNNLAEVHRVFSDHFHPEEYAPWQPLQKMRYNVSAGQPLFEHPMVTAAVNILNFTTQGFDLKTLSWLKNTPFIDWGDDADAVRRFLYRQSLLSYPNYSCSYLIKAIEKEPESDKLRLLKKRINSMVGMAGHARAMTNWIDAWKAILKGWGWLQNRTLDSVEKRLEQQFYQTLDESLGLALIEKKIKPVEAREYLFQLLRQKIFQLPSDRNDVHVLGVLEASGLEFDELILVGFNRKNWPQKASFNPFIPVDFQQAFDMPGSSADREYEYARDLSLSLLKSSDKVWITQSADDGGEVSAESAFFSEFPALKNFSDISLKSKPESKLSLLTRDKIDSDYLWRKDDQVKLACGDISGGAYLLSHYATCPFRALTSFQFKLEAPQALSRGIEAKTKGAWLHLAVELFWNKIKTQQQLLILSGSEIEKEVELALLESRQEFSLQLEATSAPEIIEIEFYKLRSQLIEWLTIDAQREPFEVATEVEKKLQLGALKFTLRVDRIDTNQAGELEIIDYKTGKTDIKKWLGKRPEEAQMPAYVLACNDSPIRSLSYACVKTGEVARSGVNFSLEDESQYQFFRQTSSEKKDLTKSILRNDALIENNKTLAEQWRDNLTSIAENILAGKMPVSPKKQTESCRYCDYSAVCRIAENQPDETELAKYSQAETATYSPNTGGDE